MENIDKSLVVPTHIGFIMDGNGRWAQKRGKTRTMGHRKAISNIEEVITYCNDRGVKVVSLYAFSTENWKRPKTEVDYIFNLLRRFFDKFYKKFIKGQVKLTTMGDISALPEDLIQSITKCIKDTENFDKMIVNIGINYGSRQELCKAFNELVKEGKNEITEEDIESKLYTANLPDPDIIVRTSGEIRLSNFMMYQASYSEFYFTETLWPDFHAEDVEKVIVEYNRRNRRYGNV